MCTAAELTAFKRRLAKVDPVLANVIRAAGKFTHDPSAQHTPFHALARAIAHQQLNGTAAESIFGRFVGLYAVDGAGSRAARSGAGARHARRETARGGSLVREDREHQGSRARRRSTASCRLRKSCTRSRDDEIVERHHAGARHRPLDGRDDADVAARPAATCCRSTTSACAMGSASPMACAACRRPRALAEFGARWAPYRSVAAWYLWRAVDLHRAGKLPAPAIADAHQDREEESREEDAAKPAREEETRGKPRARSRSDVSRPAPRRRRADRTPLRPCPSCSPRSTTCMLPHLRVPSRKRVAARLELPCARRRQRVGLELQHVGRELVMEARRARRFPARSCRP